MGKLLSISGKCIHYPGGTSRPWGVTDIGDHWAIVHTETLATVLMGKFKLAGRNSFDRALAEAARRNGPTPAAQAPAKLATARPELSFDGFGINGPDTYRSRIVTFPNNVIDADRAKYGPLFEAAPDLLAALKNIMDVWPNTDKVPGWIDRWTNALAQARAAIAQATKGTL